jgi:type I restriction enzyme S subunit
MGSTFRYLFKPGQVLFVSARPYLRKVGVPDFAGVVADKTYVLDAAPGNGLLHDMLPFLLTSDRFVEYATQEATGSMNPRLLWGAMQRYEFHLPPIDDQKRIADLLWTVERHRRASDEQGGRLVTADAVWTRSMLSTLDWSLPLADVILPDRPLCYGVVQPGVDTEDGVGLIRVLDLETSSPRLASLKRVTPEIDTQYRRSRVRAGDVLLSIVGTIGRTWVVTNEFSECNIARALARISPDPSAMRPEFLHWVLSSTEVQESLDTAAFESARKTLNLSALSKVLLPRLPRPEQDQLLNERATFSIAATRVSGEAASLSTLRSSLLADVFGATDGSV